ncbi:hypothetical protein [Mucilaginibacter lacusdianchii]|uniref:hypothetical protein n=1 Tax=Mucilaginibacter lacusdianchii TaxID=2684211 RepID=UPI00131E496F|nr:hypothetical protein [Mucilaginibacter sp. JXJ CY 39]
MTNFNHTLLSLKSFTVILLLFAWGKGLAQQTEKRDSKLTPQVKEEYEVLKSDLNTRQGTYVAFYKKQMLAAGRYNQNKKVGSWTFFNLKKEVIQRFNYDSKTLIYEAREDSTSGFKYIIDKPIADTDRVTKPIKPGGRYYGYLRYLNLFQLPKDLIGINNDLFDYTIELLISPYGRLAEYKVHIQSRLRPEEDENVKMNINLLSDEEKTFIPATLNKESISSRILIRCRLSGTDRITFWDMK